MVSYLIPIVAIGWGVFDGELITIYHFIGFILILFGVYLSKSKK
jgi:drug/metabolite transporter (DMT)-like permease